MNTKVLAAAMLLMTSGAPIAVAQSSRDANGYLDLREVEGWFDVEPSIEVNIEGALLRLAAAASRFEDEELATLLGKLESVQVRGFPSYGPLPEGLRERRDALATRLTKEGWDSVVRVRKHDENVDVFAKTSGEKIAGLVVVVLNNHRDETVFVNIVGDIDPDQIGRVGRRLSIEELRDW
jgi:hypothetical protein